jgi:hypothetical protein
MSEVSRLALLRKAVETQEPVFLGDTLVDPVAAHKILAINEMLTPEGQEVLAADLCRHPHKVVQIANGEGSGLCPNCGQDHLAFLKNMLSIMGIEEDDANPLKGLFAGLGQGVIIDVVVFKPKEPS